MRFLMFGRLNCRGRIISLVACLMVLVGMLAAPRTTQAQVLYGSVTGNVTDPSGAVLPGARVVALNVATGVAREGMTDSTGLYRFPELLPGIYRVTISAANFNAVVTENVSVAANTVRRVDAQLQLKQQVESVTVTGRPPDLQTDRADVHAQMEASQLASLPITSSAGRSFQSLYRIIPGFGVATERNSGAGNPQRSMTTNVNGGSSQGNVTRIDGALDTYIWLPANVAYVPPADSIETVSIVTNSYDAEQGMSGGSAAVNLVTKSGTNQFHGSAYEYHNDHKLRALNIFTPWAAGGAAPTKPKDILNQYGANVGGPIKKNKLFFFGDWERTTRRQVASKFGNVPNPAALFDSSGNVSFASAIPAGTNCDTTPTAGCIYDPNTGAAAGSGRTAFPSNTVPAGRIDPAAKTMLQRIATAGFLNNQGVTGTNYGQNANNYYANYPTMFNRDTFDVKVNYVPNQRSMVFARYSLSKAVFLDRGMLGDAFGDSIGGGQPGSSPSRIQAAGLGGSYSISSNMLIDVNAGYTRQRLGAQGQDIALGAFGLNTLHIPGTNGPDLMQAGIPSFQISNFANMGNPNTGSPFLFRDNQYVANTNLGWIKGSHDLRFGLEYSRGAMNHFQPQGGAFQTARGTFQFTGTATGLNATGAPAANYVNALAEFLLGLPNRVGKAVQNVNPNSLRWRSWSLYARDRWQVTPKLTLSYGVRWEYYPFATADHGGARVFDPTTGNVLIGGHGSVPVNDGVKVGHGLFLPRLGIAYRLAPKTVIRAGYGMSADNNNFRFLRNAFPATTNSDVNQTSGFAPAASLTGETLVPYPTLTAGIPAVALPDISSGVVALPNNTGTTTMPMDFRRGYFHSYNLTVQHEFAGFVGEVAYVGTRGIRALTNGNINAAPAGGGNAGRELNAALGKTWTDINSVRPHQNTYYDSLQTRLTRRLGGSSMVGIVYTLSKTLDSEDDEELNSLLWPYSAYLGRNKALAGFDRTHNLAVYGVYELPFGRAKRWAKQGIAGALAGGWQVNWVLTRVSGTPLTLTGGGSSLNAPGNTETLDQVGPINIVGGIGPRQTTGAKTVTCPATEVSCHYFDPSAFTGVPTGQARFGTTGRNILRGPGLFNLDTSLFRDFNITERLKLQFRAEAFSVTNTPHYANPGTSWTSGSTSFGVITSTLNLAGQMPGSGGERWLWFALKLMF
jgi:hypothetical protein